MEQSRAGLDGLLSCHLDRPHPRVLEECEVRLGKAARKGLSCDLGTHASLVPEPGKVGGHMQWAGSLGKTVAGRAGSWGRVDTGSGRVIGGM